MQDCVTISWIRNVLGGTNTNRREHELYDGIQMDQVEGRHQREKTLDIIRCLLSRLCQVLRLSLCNHGINKMQDSFADGDVKECVVEGVGGTEIGFR